ncbi:hypothetical protein AAMO2058_000416000 [Amorphochlora amoebiformis]
MAPLAYLLLFLPAASPLARHSGKLSLPQHYAMEDRGFSGPLATREARRANLRKFRNIARKLVARVQAAGEAVRKEGECNNSKRQVVYKYWKEQAAWKVCEECARLGIEIKEGVDHNTILNRLVDEITALAVHFATQPPVPSKKFNEVMSEESRKKALEREKIRRIEGDVVHQARGPEDWLLNDVGPQDWGYFNARGPRGDRGFSSKDRTWHKPNSKNNDDENLMF